MRKLPALLIGLALLFAVSCGRPKVQATAPPPIAPVPRATWLVSCTTLRDLICGEKEMDKFVAELVVLTGAMSNAPV